MIRYSVISLVDRGTVSAILEKASKWRLRNVLRGGGEVQPRREVRRP